MTSFDDFQQQYSDDEACLKRIMFERYGGTELDCPKCGVFGKFYRMTKERGYVCQHCGHHLHPTVGTPMERTRLPLHKWFYAMFLFSTSRHGVAAKELERQLQIPYKTAWRMAHEIRKYMAQVDDEIPLGGGVDADETYVGGKTTGGKRGRGAPNKTVVFGMLERGGDVMAKVVPDVTNRTLQPIVTENVEPGSTIHTRRVAILPGAGPRWLQALHRQPRGWRICAPRKPRQRDRGFLGLPETLDSRDPCSRFGEAPSEVRERV